LRKGDERGRRRREREREAGGGEGQIDSFASVSK
jgi:hypothetical protein